jgi:hypothetical protein
MWLVAADTPGVAGRGDVTIPTATKPNTRRQYESLHQMVAVTDLTGRFCLYPVRRQGS